METALLMKRARILAQGTSINSFCGRIAASRARSLLAYQVDMSRCSLRGSLRFIPQNEFLEVPTGHGSLDKLSLAFIFSIRIMRALSPLRRHWFIVF
jgi:hypothetical protein